MVATITLPSDIATTVRKMVDRGDFTDTDSVLREAVQLLQDRLEEQRFLASIEEARRSRAEGHSLPWNEETIARIWQEGIDDFRRGVAPDPDVCPE